MNEILLGVGIGGLMLAPYAREAARWARALRVREGHGAGERQRAGEAGAEMGEGAAYTVVIPCRNEAERVGRVLRDLACQTHRPQAVIVVDDGSDDGTVDAARAAGAVVLTAGGTGKKAALRTGMEAVRTDWVATLDADVRVGPGWGEAMARHADEGAEVVLGPVGLLPQGGGWAAVQTLEYHAMQGWTAHTALAGRAENGSGANIWYRRSTWLAADRGEEWASGDDVFVIRDVVRRGGGVRWGGAGPGSEAAWAWTVAAPGWRAWVAQRARWASKASDPRAPRQTAALVGGAVLLQWSTAAAACVAWPTSAGGLAAGVALGANGLKMAADALLLRSVVRHTPPPPDFGPHSPPDRPSPAARWPPLVFHLVYPCLVANTWLKMLLGATHWKGRKV